MQDDQKKPNNGIWWRPAVQIFTEISTWIAFPVIAAALGGTALDKHYGTKPQWLLLCAGAAFLVSAYGITSTVRKFAKLSPPAKGEMPKAEGVLEDLNK